MATMADKKKLEEKPKEGDKRPKSPLQNPKTPDKKKQIAPPVPDKNATKKKGKKGKDDEEDRLVPVEFGTRTIPFTNVCIFGYKI